MSNDDDQLSGDGILRIVRAIRFAFVALLIGMSCFLIRGAILMGSFAVMYDDMLGGKPLPMLTASLLNHKTSVLIVSFAIPVCAILLGFDRKIVRSFCLLGALMLLTLMGMTILNIGLLSPLSSILNGMANPAP